MSDILGEIPLHLAQGIGPEQPIGQCVQPVNNTGIIPTEFKVLVLPDESETELRAKRSGLVVPQDAADNYRHAAVTGRILAMSPAAFGYHEWQPGDRIPQVGDRVVYGRYAGMRVTGRPDKDDKGWPIEREFRLLNDKDIGAVLDF